MDASNWVHLRGRVIANKTDLGECSVVVDDRGLCIDREVIKPARIVGGVTELFSNGSCQVSFVERTLSEMLFNPFTIDVEDREVGARLLRALGIAQDQRALDVSLSHQTTLGDLGITLLALLGVPTAISTLVAFGYAGFAWSIAAAVMLLAALPAALLAYRFLFRVRIVVGLDGISRKTWRTRRHILFDEIASVERDGFGPVLCTRLGESIHLFEWMNNNQRATVGELLYRRIWQGHFAHSEICAKRSTTEDFRDLGARPWIRALRSHAVDGGVVHYRVAARSLPNLDEAILDVTQPLQMRVGAAIALRAKEGESAASRIRVAADASAMPRVRELFEKIAENASEDDLARRIEAIK